MKGISPIVAVVLLLAMTVIAGVGIYFWALSLSSKQATPEAPTSIVVNPVGKGKLLIANLGQHSINTTNLKSTDSGVQLECESDIIPPGGQVLCTLKGNASSDTIVIYGNNTNQVVIGGGNKEVDNPPTISDLTDNSTDGEILLGDTLRVQAKASDDVGLKSVILHADNPSGDFEMQDVGNDIYVKDITPQIAGELNYFVTANDTSDQSAQSATHTVEVIENWMKAYGGGSDDVARSIIQTSDGGYVIAGGTGNFFVGGGDAILIKVNSSGNIEWAKAYGGGSYDEGMSVIQTSDGGYVIAGDTTSFGVGAHDVLLIKTNKNGDLANCNHYSDITSQVQVNNGPSSPSWSGTPITTDITSSLNTTDISSSMVMADVDPTTTCVCQPFGCG